MEEISIKLNKQQLVILINVLNEILNGSGAIEEWEFDTRIGAKKEEAQELLNLLSKTHSK